MEILGAAWNIERRFRWQHLQPRPTPAPAFAPTGVASGGEVVPGTTATTAAIADAVDDNSNRRAWAAYLQQAELSSKSRSTGSDGGGGVHDEEEGVPPSWATARENVENHHGRSATAAATEHTRKVTARAR